MKGESAEVWAEVETPQGYIHVKTPDGWKLKHRLVMEQVLGRPLAAGERIIFKDGDRKNCDPENLVLQIVKKENLSDLYAQRAKLLRQLEQIDERIKLKENVGAEATA